MTTISLKNLDVGFDLRATGHAIDVPTCIGTPSEIFEVETDDGTITGRACDVGSQLRKRGYAVTPRWFEGREQWAASGRVVADHCGRQDRQVFAAVGRMAAAERRLKDRGILSPDATPSAANLAALVAEHPE